MPGIKKFAFENAEFIAMLAHDLKTPVKAQLRAMNLLYSGAFGTFNEEAENLIKNIIASNKYMQCLLDNVLSDFRINNGKFILNKAINDLRKTIEEAAKNVGVLFDVKEQTISIKYLTDDFKCLYDEIEIQRVIINFLSNANEYGAENSQIKIFLNKEGGKFKFRLVNKRGARALNISSSCLLRAGDGLGLSICDKIISAHGGEFIKEETKEEYIIGFNLPVL